VFRRQSGSHAVYVRPADHARFVVPRHKGELKRKTLRAIIQDLKITVDQFAELLEILWNRVRHTVLSMLSKSGRDAFRGPGGDL